MRFEERFGETSAGFPNKDATILDRRPNDPDDAEGLQLSVEFIEWTGRSRSFDGDFDYGDEADFRQGIDLAAKCKRRR